MSHVFSDGRSAMGDKDEIGGVIAEVLTAGRVWRQSVRMLEQVKQNALIGERTVATQTWYKGPNSVSLTDYSR